MTSERIYLYSEDIPVYLDVFLCDESDEYSISQRPFMLVCPGGGYKYCSPREAEPVARAYMAEGYNTAILYYSTTDRVDTLFDKEKGFAKPHYEVARAILTIRQNSEKWHTDPEKICVIGFSAGGHLAGCAAFMYKDESILRELSCSAQDIRPDAVILGYSVSTSGEYAHKGSYKNLLGDGADDELISRYTPEKRVDEDAPPVFLFHTSCDKAVPVQNSCLMAKAIADNKLTFELHVFPEAKHGMSVASREVLSEANKYNRRWVGWSCDWLETIFDL
ncbi:MAG: alpha/beta hydrolase [Ruminococcaceae bacterium]|nr:alpha/beta hydrolase [Oscillospiraceae bacterium]